MYNTKYKYLLFGWDSYEAFGGIGDLVIGFGTLEEFKENFVYEDFYHWQLVNTYDFTYKDFVSNILYRVGIDDYELIKAKRFGELFRWIQKNIK